MQQHLPQIVQDLAPFLDRFGYWAVLGSIFFEDFGVPLPGETMLVAGSFFAALGQFGVGWVLLLECRSSVPVPGPVRGSPMCALDGISGTAVARGGPGPTTPVPASTPTNESRGHEGRRA